MPTVTLTDRKIAGLKATGAQADYFDRSFPGFGVRVNQQGRKTFMLMFRNAEKKLRRLTLGVYGTEAPGITLATARGLARKELDKATIGRDPAAERKTAKAHTFAALVPTYIEKHAKRHKRSWRDDARRLRRLVPIWGTMPVKAITRAHVRDLLDGIVTRGRKVEANRMLALVRKVLNFAVDQEWIDANPAGKMKQPGGRETSRSRVLTADELRATWRYLHAEPSDDLQPRDKRIWRLTRASLLLRLLTAQRGREVVQMRWRDVDGDWWTVPGAIAKNGLEHRVPLTAEAKAVLTDLRPQTVEGSDYVFTGIRGTRQRAGALDDLGIADVRPHDFRRTAATLMTSAGVSRLVVAKVLNHVDRGVTSIYDRAAYDSEKRIALETWARTLKSIITGEHQGGGVVPFQRGA